MRTAERSGPSNRDPVVELFNHPHEEQAWPIVPDWAVPTATAAAVVVGLLALVWASQHIQVDPSLHVFAVFVHLMSLVVGFGAVLSVDAQGLLWLLGRRPLSQVTGSAHTCHALIWGGLVGLVASGMLLRPDTSLGLTRLKIALVIAVAVNGVYAGRVHKRMVEMADDRPTTAILSRALITVSISQVGWWGAVAIGFFNTAGRTHLI